MTVKDTLCCCDVELLAVNLRPYYLPWEFTQVIAMCVFIHPRADTNVACERIHSAVAWLQSQHPDAFFVISGDFNHMTLALTLAFFHQFVDCPTRTNSTIDLLYAIVSHAHRASPLPPLGKSDHNFICLLIEYTPMVKKQPITTWPLREWYSGAEEILKDCFDSTD